MKMPAVLALTTLLTVAGSPAAQIVFRSTVDSVTVDVSVQQAGRPVADLTAADFEVRDNDRPQRLLDVTREVSPIDVTFVVDLSGSVQGPLLEALTRAVGAVASRLRPVDRRAVLTFNDRVREVHALAPGGLPSPVALGQPRGLTALFDALSLALITVPEPGRRRMTMVFTDGVDTASLQDGPALVELARRSDSAVFSVAVAAGTPGRRVEAPHQRLFETLAEDTGGASIVLQPNQDLGASFVNAFEQFRTSYVLRYTYEGPRQPGWHSLAVRVTRRGTYEIRARQGYFVSN